MMGARLLHARGDGSYVVERNGFPCHVTLGEMTPEEAGLVEGGASLPPEPLPFVPDVPAPGVHIAWLKLALHDLGKLAAVEQAVKADPRVTILWNNVTIISPTDPEVIALGTALKIDIPALFADAHAISATR